MTGTQRAGWCVSFGHALIPPRRPDIPNKATRLFVWGAHSQEVRKGGRVDAEGAYSVHMFTCASWH